MSSFGNFRDGLSGLSGKMSQLQRRLSQGMMQDDEVPRDQPSLGSSAASSPNPPLSNPAFSSSTLPNSTGNQPNQNSMYNSASSSIQMQQQSSSANNASSSLRGDRPNMSLNLNSTSPGGGGVSGSGNVQGGVGPGAAGAGGNPSMMMTGGPPGSAYQRQQQQRQQQQQQEEQARQQQGRHVSAPTSPTKTTATGSAANIARSIFRQVSQSTTNLVQQTVAGVSGGPRDKAKILLVIDDQHTDWSKYFRGRRIQNEFDVRIEQAEFNEINMAAFSDRGTMVDMEVTRGGTKVVRSFRPDFVLIRQPIRDANRDYRHILLALMYGNVPSVNSLDSLYTFLDKPLVFSQLIQIQQRLGRDKFPLIQQSFYPNHREMLTAPSFPVVCKIGHAHAGLGKVRVDSHYDFQDVASLVGSCGAYCSVEPFVDSKQDLHLQKIGPSYKAFIRKSISGSWKANIGSSMLEQIPLQEKHRFWLDECSRLFGGLDVFAIEAVVGKDGQEFIIGLNDSSSMGLLGETQEEDRQLIGEIVYRKMDSDANRRRLSAVQSSAGSAAPPSGVNQSGPSGGQVPNGYASGGQPRRSSRDATTDGPSGASTRERDQSVPNYAQRNSGMTTDRPSGPPTMGPPSGGPYGRPDVTGRDPPTRDPRDSNIRDVSGMRDSSRNTSMDREAGPPPPPPLAPGSRDLQNNREVPTREGSNSRFRDGPMDPRTAGSFGGAGGVPASGSSGSGVGSQQPQPHSYAGAGLPPRQMSRGNMGGTVGSSGGDPTSGGSGSNRGSLSQQGQGLAGGPQQQQQGRMPGQVGGDTEDTMSNLKKTFAGIFGDM